MENTTFFGATCFDKADDHVKARPDGDTSSLDGVSLSQCPATPPKT